MLLEKVEGKWVKLFAELFGRSGVTAGTSVVVLCETQSRPVLVELSKLALSVIGANAFVVEMLSPPLGESIPVRSTGTTYALQNNAAAMAALSRVEVVIDCTVEGLLHSVEATRLLGGSMRWLMLSNEHPEVFERIALEPDLEARVRLGADMLAAASIMHVGSEAGTDLRIDVSGAPGGGDWGVSLVPGQRAHIPGGIIACYPLAGTVNGRLVLAPGDANLTFKRYVESPIALTIENDVVTAIEGSGLDAELMRSYFAAWADPNAYTVSHVGWGMSRLARWDALVMYDRRDVNGTELRAFAGNFLFSTGANEHAGRFTKCHFDLPMRNCSVALDGRLVVDRGQLQGDLR